MNAHRITARLVLPALIAAAMVGGTAAPASADHITTPCQEDPNGVVVEVSGDLLGGLLGGGEVGLLGGLLGGGEGGGILSGILGGGCCPA